MYPALHGSVIMYCLFNSTSEAPVSELSLELLLLQVVLPALLEQGHTRQWLKNLVRGWCLGVAYLLDLRSYLLGDIPLDNEEVSVIIVVLHLGEM
jgi:hypothetical protein